MGISVALQEPLPKPSLAYGSPYKNNDRPCRDRYPALFFCRRYFFLSEFSSCSGPSPVRFSVKATIDVPTHLSIRPGTHFADRATAADHDALARTHTVVPTANLIQLGCERESVDA